MNGRTLMSGHAYDAQRMPPPNRLSNTPSLYVLKQLKAICGGGRGGGEEKKNVFRTNITLFR